MKKPPIPKKIKKILKNHDDKRIDNYFWLRDDKRKNKDVLNYLNKENNYTEQWFKKNKVNSKHIFEYFNKAIPRSEESFKNKID